MVTDSMRNKSRFVQLAGLFGCLCALFLGWQIGERTPFLSATDGALDIGEQPSGSGTLAVVFQPEDCESSSQFIKVWTQLRDASALEVIGIPINAPPDTQELAMALGNLKPDYPLRPDLGEDIATLLVRHGHTKTPIAVLLDPQGRPRMFIPGDVAPRHQTKILNLIQNYEKSFLRVISAPR